MATADDDSLARHLRQGDQDALATLFSTHRERLLRILQVRIDPRLQGRVDPEDVLQEVYLAAVQRLGSYREQDGMTPFVWLRLLVGQTLTDVHRRHIGAAKRTADQEISLHRIGPGVSSAAISARLVGTLTSPSQVLIRAEDQDRLAAALEVLEPIDREVLVLRHFEELSNNEVATLLGLQKSAASNRYIRALERLRRKIEEPGDTGGGAGGR